MLLMRDAMKYLCILGLISLSCCSWSLEHNEIIRKNMYKKQHFFANQTSLAQLRKMQINRLKHNV